MAHRYTYPPKPVRVELPVEGNRSLYNKKKIYIWVHMCVVYEYRCVVYENICVHACICM